MDSSDMAASTVSIQDCLTCYLCGDIYRRPRVLPCGHTFCSECLARQKDEIIGNGHYHKREARSEASDCIDGNYRQWLKPSDHNISHKQHQYSSPGGSSKNSDDSSNVDTHDADPNCYRPQSCIRSHFRRSDPGGVFQAPQDGMAKNGTFIRERPKSASESHSCFSTSSENLANPKTCTHCGHFTTSQKGKMPQRTPSLRDKSPMNREGSKPISQWDSSPHRSTASHLPSPAGSFEQKHGREMEHFICPLPDCNYSIRVMNLSRWSPRNKTVADVVGVWTRLQENKQDAGTQTDISTNQSILVSIPRSLIHSQSVQTLSHRRRHSSMMDMAIDSAISMDSLDSGYIPRGHLNWRSYAAMVGMNILHQIVNL